MKKAKLPEGKLALGSKSGLWLVRCLLMTLCVVLLFSFAPANAMASEGDDDVTVTVTLKSSVEGAVYPGERVTYKVHWKVKGDKEYNFVDTLDDAIATEGIVYSTESDTKIIHADGTRELSWSVHGPAEGALAVEGELTIECTVMYVPSHTKLNSKITVNSKEIKYATSKDGVDAAIMPSVTKEDDMKSGGLRGKNQRDVMYTISFRNWTDDDDATVKVTDNLDKNLEFVSQSVLQPSDFDFAFVDGTATWVFKHIKKGESKDIILNCYIKDEGLKVSNIANVAEVEINKHTEHSQVNRLLIRPEIIKDVAEKEVHVGETVHYTITSFYAEENMQVIDELDSKLDYVSSDVDGIPCNEEDVFDPGSHTVTWELSDRKLGSEFTIHLVARVNEKANVGDRIRNRAEMKFHINDQPVVSEYVYVTVIGDQNPTLVISKDVRGEHGDTNKQFHFTIQLNDTTVNGQKGDVSFRNGVSEFYLRDGEEREITGISNGVEYTVREEPVQGYDTTVNGMADNEFTGVIGEDDEVRFVNAFDGKGNLRITKRVCGEEADPDQAFDFIVQLDDQTISGRYGDLYFDLGIAEFSLKDDESVTARNLPAGVRYAVTEIDANKNGYITSTMDSVGQIEIDDTAWASFVNYRPSKPTKEVTNVDVEKGDAVGPGDTLSYRITWLNDCNTRVNVVITDPLDEGVDFVSADNGGVYDAKTRTVTWTLKNTEPDTSGSVALVVKVNEKALKQSEVSNQAEVQLGNYPSQKTEKVDVPVNDKPHKVLLSPEKDVIVPVGDEICFSISWKNRVGDGAKITITDPLDDCVDFVNADNGGTYDPDTHTVTWVLNQQKAEASGVVILRVKVNEKALQQGAILNQAKVQLNEGTPELTEEVRVPTDTEDPQKKLVSPAEGTAVHVGDKVSYQITWKNVYGSAAVIEDVLDNGVDFVSAEGGTYNSETRTVTWTIPEQLPGTDNTFTLTVQVNPYAASAKKVDNQAAVQFGNVVKQTEIVSVPVDETTERPVKTEIEPGEGLAVEIGKEISYSITWKNQTGADATVTVQDVLEAGLEYVRASEGSVYDPETRTVTWTIADQKAGAESEVSLVVRVTADAAAAGKVANKAIVQIGTKPSLESNVVENPLKRGTLIVSKTVAGVSGEVDRVWHFTITLDNASVNGTFGTLEFVQGEAHFTLKHGEKISIEGLPAGLGYQITEAEADMDQYKTRSRHAEGAIQADTDISVTFVNSKGAEVESTTTGSMAVRKLVTGNLGDSNREFHFKVVLSDTSINGWYGEMEFVDGVAEISLRSGEHLWARYLPVGTSYTVTEDEADQEGYRTIVSGEEGIIFGNSRLEARFQNHKGDWLPEYDEPWVDLPDPDVPQADIPDTPPATGDQWACVLWITLMAASALCAAALITERKRRRS